MEKISQLSNLSKGKKALSIALIIGLSLLTILVVLRVAYRGRIYPGVTANGVYLSGLTPNEALRELNVQASSNTAKQVEVLEPQSKQMLSASDFGVSNNSTIAMQSALAVGRDGWLGQRLLEQISALVGQNPPITAVMFDSEKLSTTVVGINTSTAKPVQNAQYILTNDQVSVQASQKGTRIDFARLPRALGDYFGQLQSKEFVLPTISIEPQLSSQNLETQKNIITPYEKTPLQLSYGTKAWTADANTIVSWLSAPNTVAPINTNLLTHYYQLKNITNSSLAFDPKAVRDYVSTLSEQINVAAVDAELTISGDKATVFKQSRDGKTLNVEASTQAILNSLATPSTTPVALVVDTQKADVSDGNIESLGIKELLSEGVTYFPNSPPNRMHNIKLGTSKFNGVLVKPGEVFSFNDHLGEVSNAAGYTDGLVILGDHEEKQAGGGLCQVSSTAYRAALLAGLPILARTNHAFAVSYYTAPYGIPGVDATIYLPGVDMKFRNDTGKHILIQTELVGTTLKFRFYGTKVKSGVIRGPQFVSGSLDATVPSHTVFFRDVVDLTGKVVKTDEINTYYKSSLDFPITD